MAERKDLKVEEVIEMESLPSNSHASKERSSLDKANSLVPTKKKEVSRITKGRVKRKKAPLGQRVAATIIGEDAPNVGSYLLDDVLVPAFKDLISDMVTNGIQMLLFGNPTGSRSNRSRNSSRVSYSKYWEDEEDRTYRRRNKRRTQTVDDLIFDSRAEAEEILTYLVDMIDQYECVSVADLYDMAGLTSEYTDQKWGWYSVASGSVIRDRDGYTLRLPKPVALD